MKDSIVIDMKYADYDTNTLKQVLCLNFVAKYLENRKKF